MEKEYTKEEEERKKKKAAVRGAETSMFLNSNLLSFICLKVNMSH